MSSAVARCSPPAPRVLVVDDDQIALENILRMIRQCHPQWTVVGLQSAADALALLEREPFDAAVIDLIMPTIDGLKILACMQQRDVELPIIMLTASDGVETAVECMRRGAYDFQVKPPDPARLGRIVANAVQRTQVARATAAATTSDPTGFGEIVGLSPKMKTVFRQIERVCNSTVSVLVHGETGTGKELVARAIHHGGQRGAGPWVSLNCGAIPEHLQESVLFGHEKGAFTGAIAARKGSFEQADGGTLFLDEVGELSPAAQVRLLRVLQEGELMRVGGVTPIRLDSRVVSATHRDLRVMVEQGSFREDLYYRLVVYPIRVPALRERLDDIALLVQRFLHKHAADAPCPIARIEPQVLRAFESYPWPGNVRELENVMRRAMINVTDGEITMACLPAELARRPTLVATTPPPRPMSPDGAGERATIEDALQRSGGNVTRAAQQLGISRATIYRKMARYGIASPKRA